MGLLKIFLVLCLIGLLDTFILGGVNYDPVACEEVGVSRIGLHQGKNEAWVLYFFIAHIYDNILNPWHWTDDMRKASLTSGNFGLAPGLKVVDVGAGTGFTTIGVLEEKVTPGDVIMLDQSPQQLSKARVKPELKGLKAILEGDAENLPKEWTGKFDRYVSAGSIEYWPHPQLAIDEAARVVNEGGKAMIIGPVRATNPLSRFFADMWYLFPEEREYEAWFKSAGFTNVTISRVTPSWYAGDRTHGLIMGCAVVGTKPAGWTPPVRKATSSQTKSSQDNDGWNRLVSIAMAAPRFALGTLGGAYYTLLPVAIYAKNVWLGGSWLAFFAATILPLLIAVVMEVAPRNFKPLGAGPELRQGVAKLYDDSSAIWESVWGEHMHTGFYDDFDDDTEFTMQDHLDAQTRMMEMLLGKWESLLAAARRATEEGRPLRILDVGCGVGGSSRFLYNEVTSRALESDIDVTVEVVGITLSQYQRDRAEERSSRMVSKGASLTFKVLNALDTKFPPESFDLVWSLESGEHMPDKPVWLNEVSRLLSPGGTFVVATWCSRETYDAPLTADETRLLTRICKNYALPEFVPLSAYGEAAASAGLNDFAATEESWSEDITPFWPAVIYSALRPQVLLQLILSWNWTTIKGGITAYLMMKGFADETLNFGVFALTKPGGQRRSSRAKRDSVGRR